VNRAVVRCAPPADWLIGILNILDTLPPYFSMFFEIYKTNAAISSVSWEYAAAGNSRYVARNQIQFDDAKNRPADVSASG
jgi:hypothetical protein